MSTDSPWPGDERENAAIAALAETLRGMADLLYAVDQARYLDPSGGYAPYRGPNPAD
ncbi:hypothetical protein [Nocardia sp. NPDC051570]|uniref:hypothetical protein n=1 Tax=Nocardia sp. NPDC051570 TaxID=3364324 RepID=UPI003794527A